MEYHLAFNIYVQWLCQRDFHISITIGSKRKMASSIIGWSNLGGFLASYFTPENYEVNIADNTIRVLRDLEYKF